MEAVLPLFAAYQRFYGAPRSDDDRNRRFLVRFARPSDAGELLVASLEGQAVGFATLYWTFSSVLADEVVLMNDLYVRDDARGAGVGAALIRASEEVTRARGVSRLRWWTQPDNHPAQRLYETTGARRSVWLEYNLAVKPG